MRKYLVFVCLAAACCHAQDNGGATSGNSPLKVDILTRVGYYGERVHGETDHSASGFKGDYLFLFVRGDINRQFSYSWRQRLNKGIDRSHLFEATDWLYVDYRPTDRWTLSAGKQVVLIGGYEYDRNPLDVFAPSEFWMNIGCFQFGASAQYAMGKGNDALTAQVAASPFRTDAHNDLLSYNLQWNGHHGIWHPMYSVNMIEHRPGRYISYLALGNRFTLGSVPLGEGKGEVPRVAVEADFMNRAASHQTVFFRDCSVIANVDWRIVPRVQVYGKVAYDVNRTTATDADLDIMPGTELTTVAAGVEYYPLKTELVRLHAGVAHTTGKNSNPGGSQVDGKLQMAVGLSAKIPVFKIDR